MPGLQIRAVPFCNNTLCEKIRLDPIPFALAQEIPTSLLSIKTYSKSVNIIATVLLNAYLFKNGF